LSQSDGITRGCTAIGSHTSGALPTVSPKNSGGATPMMVAAAWLISIDWPSAAGLRANSRSQNASLMTATGGAAGRSSAVVKVRPRRASTPSVWK
jgi:hypothetical protein